MHGSIFVGITRVLVASVARSCMRLVYIVDLRGMGYDYRDIVVVPIAVVRIDGDCNFGNYLDLVSQVL